MQSENTVSVNPNSTQESDSLQNDSSRVETPIVILGDVKPKHHNTKKSLSLGIYIVFILILMSFIASFFDSSQNSILFTYFLLAQLILGIGLLLKKEMARKILVWVLGVTAAFAVTNIILLFALQSSFKADKINYNSEVDKFNASPDPTLNEEQQLDKARIKLISQRKKIGKSAKFSYLKNGATAIGDMLIIFYLTKPIIKKEFKK